MVQLLAVGMHENGTYQEFGTAALQIFEKNALGFGKRKPVRQVKNMGGSEVFFQQHIQVHISHNKDKYELRGTKYEVEKSAGSYLVIRA
jgi:hypothetical protein